MAELVEYAVVGNISSAYNFDVRYKRNVPDQIVEA
jgi:hypothetical protein